MKRTEWLQETRKMRFEEAYEGWRSGKLTQVEAALLLGVCDRTFRRYMIKYGEGGLEARMDKRLTQASHRCAPVDDEVMQLPEQYRSHYSGWNVKHFHGSVALTAFRPNLSLISLKKNCQELLNAIEPTFSP